MFETTKKHGEATPTWQKVGIGAGTAAALLAAWVLAGRPAGKTAGEKPNSPDESGEVVPANVEDTREKVRLRMKAGDGEVISVERKVEERTPLTHEQKEALRIALAPLMGETMDTIGLSESITSQIAARVMEALDDAGFQTNQSQVEAMLSRFNVVDETETEYGHRLITVRIGVRYERTEDGTDAYPVRTASVSRVIGEESYELEAEDEESLQAMVVEQIKSMTGQE